MQAILGAFRSRTIWFNVLGFAAYALAYPQMSQYISPSHLGMVTTAVGVALRFVTSEPLAIKAQ